MPTIFGQPRYVGTKDFSITVNQPTHVTVGCAMANAAFKVQKDASFCYNSFTVTASCNGRTLTFTNDKDMGYFNIDFFPLGHGPSEVSGESLSCLPNPKSLVK